MSRSTRAILIACALAGGTALAIWANLPDEDPWKDIPPGQPHPRIGAQVSIAPRLFVDLPPLALTPRDTQGPSHWRSALLHHADGEIAGSLPKPDQLITGPDDRLHRFWHSWAPASDAPTPWVAHLWTESKDGTIMAVHLVGGGGVLIGEAPVPRSPSPPR